jgi:hypothetical protein
MAWTLTQARSAWAHGQGLHARGDLSLAKTAAATGWLRTIGGAEAYLALVARSSKATVKSVHAAVKKGALCVVPSVRGCMYLVPKADVPLSLAVAAAQSDKRMARDLEKAGSSLDEVDGLAKDILKRLKVPTETRALSAALPEGLVRSLGPAGKKVGLTTTLPSALRRLEFAGRIARVPVDDRLDHERYAWTATGTVAKPLELEAAHDALAKRFFQWAGPATRKEFASWTGLNQTEAKAAIERGAFDCVQVEELGEAFVLAGSKPAAVGKPAVALIPALDNLFAMRLSSAMLLESEHRGFTVATFGRGREAPIGECGQPLDRTLQRGGRVFGTWGYDPATGECEAHPFKGSPKAAAQAAARGLTEVQSVFKALGHGRATSIDTEAQLIERLERMRKR